MRCYLRNYSSTTETPKDQAYMVTGVGKVLNTYKSKITYFSLIKDAQILN